MEKIGENGTSNVYIRRDGSALFVMVEKCKRCKGTGTVHYTDSGHWTGPRACPECCATHENTDGAGV